VAVVFKGILILVMPVSGLDIQFDELKDEATPWFTLVATWESSLLSVKVENGSRTPILKP
jgi:hypothetical protein